MSMSILEKLKKTVTNYQNQSNTHKEWPSTAFLPDGNHVVRLFVDPNKDPFISYWSYGYFNMGIRDPRSIDASVLPENFNNELAEYAQLFSDIRIYKYNAKFNVVAYCYLYATDAPSEGWQPNNIYVIIGDKRFGEAYTKFMSGLMERATNELVQMLDPAQPGHKLQLSSRRGRDGLCQIAPLFPAEIADPIDLEGKPYIPLDDTYIKPGFTIEKYNELLAKYKTEYVEAKSKYDEWVSSAEGKRQLELEALEEANKSTENTTSENSPAAQPVTQSVVAQPVTTIEPTISNINQVTKEEVKQQTTEPAPDMPNVSDDPWSKYTKK